VSDNLLSRLRAQYDWLDAIGEAEKSGDLAAIAALVERKAPMEFSRYPLVELLRTHRLVRKKRGAWKSMFEPSAQEKYAEAVKGVRKLEEMKREWDKVKGAEWAEGMTLTTWYGDRLDDISDPIEYVAQILRLDPEKLWNVRHGRTGFGRGRKPKAEPNRFAPLWREMWRFRRSQDVPIVAPASDHDERASGRLTNATKAPARQTAPRRSRG
jgi:hypothetical protein